MKDIPQEILRYLKKYPNTGRVRLSELFDIPESESRYICRAIKGSTSVGKVVKRGMAIGDIHFPYHDKATVNIFFEFMKEFSPDVVIFAGDCMEMDSISFHNRGKAVLLEGKRLSHDYKNFQKEILDRTDSIVKDTCEKYYIVGNHEYFVTRLIEEVPQHEGFVELENNLNFDTYTVVPFNEVLKLGRMHFIHGVYHNKYHAEKNVRTYGEQIFSWHLHTNQIFTNHSPITELPNQGVSIGCACTTNPQFLRGKPNAWLNQFMFFYLFEDGTFTYYTPIIINGRAVINNEIYEG